MLVSGAEIEDMRVLCSCMCEEFFTVLIVHLYIIRGTLNFKVLVTFGVK